MALLPESLKAEYPFTPARFLTPRGAQMSYLDEGKGEVVVMLHGNPTWSFFYRNLVKALSPHFRCIVPDHIGMGLSEKPQDYPYTLDTRIADIEALLDSLKIERFHLVVHDWGGAIGMGVATKRPASVGRIVVLNTAAFPSQRIPARIAACRAPGLGELLVRGFNGFAGPAVSMAMSRRRLTPVQKQGYLFPYDSWAHRIAVHRFVADIPMEKDHPSRARLEAIGHSLESLSDKPVLIAWGGKDFCFNDAFYAEWVRRFPKAKARRFGDVGHYILDDGGAEVVGEVADFLAAGA